MTMVRVLDVSWVGRYLLHTRQIKDRCHQTLGLTQRLAKHQAQHKASFNGKM